MKRTLIVTDNFSGAWLRGISLDKAASDTEFNVIPLSISEGAYRWIHSKSLARVKLCSWPLTKTIAERAYDRVRQELPKWISEFPRARQKTKPSLYELLQDGAVNLWWYLGFVDKSPLSSAIVNHVYYLLILQQLLSLQHYDELWCDIADSALRKCIKTNWKSVTRVRIVRIAGFSCGGGKGLVSFFKESGWLRYLYVLSRTIIKMLLLQVCLRSSQWRVGNEDDDHEAMFFTVFPTLWKKPFHLDGYDSIFMELPKYLERQFKTGFCAWITADAGIVWRWRHKIRMVFRKNKAVVLNKLLSIKDIFSLARFDIFWRLVYFQYFWGTNIDVSFCDLNIAALLKREVKRSYGSQEFFHCFLIQKAIGRLVSTRQIGTLIYRAEFQQFEKAILYGVRKRVRTIGHQHSTVGYYHLNNIFYPPAISKRWHNDDKSALMPIPDILTLTGAYGLKLYTESGFPRDMLHICGPIRFPHLAQYRVRKTEIHSRRAELGFNTERISVFMPTTWVLSEIYNLVGLVGTALDEELEKKFDFVFKCHPAARYENEIKQFSAATTPRLKPRFVFDEYPLYDYLCASDVLLNSGNTVSAEAVALGIATIVYKDVSHFPCSPLVETDRVVLTVTNSGELREALYRVLQRRNEFERDSDERRRSISLMLGSIEENPYQNFVSVMKENNSPRVHKPLKEIMVSTGMPV